MAPTSDGSIYSDSSKTLTLKSKSVAKPNSFSEGTVMDKLAHCRNEISGRTAALLRRSTRFRSGIFFMDWEAIQFDHPSFIPDRSRCKAWTSNLLGVLTAKARTRLGLRRRDDDFVATMGGPFWSDDTYMGVAMHEFNHRIAAIVPPPTANEVIAYAQAGQVDQLFAKYAVTDASAHDARFIRSLCHLWSRARLNGTTLPLSLLHPPVPVATFEKCIHALTGEIGANLTGSITALLDTPAPASFMSLVGHLGYQVRATRELPGSPAPSPPPPRPATPQPTKPVRPPSQPPARPSAEWQRRVRNAMAETAVSPYEFGVIYV